jgi:hypothetical protein
MSGRVLVKASSGQRKNTPLQAGNRIEFAKSFRTAPRRRWRQLIGDRFQKLAAGHLPTL